MFNAIFYFLHKKLCMLVREEESKMQFFRHFLSGLVASDPLDLLTLATEKVLEQIDLNSDKFGFQIAF
jgi:hypothetical protein